MKVLIERDPIQLQSDCTRGRLTVADTMVKLVTLERPWIPSSRPGDKGGVKFQSCVPLGVYRLVPHDSKKHPRTWALVNHDLDVVHYEGDDHDPDEDRATCVIHVANFVTQLEGCIAPGLYFSRVADGRLMVCKSSVALDALREALPWPQEHELEIR